VRVTGDLRFKSQVPPGNFGPISRILNQTCPEPSKSAALPGALAMYTEMGPSYCQIPVETCVHRFGGLPW
jgi:hypothetical protein